MTFNFYNADSRLSIKYKVLCILYDFPVVLTDVVESCGTSEVPLQGCNNIVCHALLDPNRPLGPFKPFNRVTDLTYFHAGTRVTHISMRNGGKISINLGKCAFEDIPSTYGVLSSYLST